MAYSILDKIHMLWDFGNKMQADAGIEYVDNEFSMKARELEGELAKRVDERITQYHDGLITCGEMVDWIIDAAMKP